MDPQTMVIGAAIFVVSAIVIYLISVCSMREKTFEEVLEEQRRLQAEELKKQKIEKKDKVRKRYPGRGKGKKDKTDEKAAVAATTPLLDSESDTDRILEPEVAEPQVVEPQVVEPVQQQKPEKKKKDKKKSREDVAVVHEEDLYEPLVKEQVEEVMVEAQKAAPVEMEAPARDHAHKKSKRAHKEEQQHVEEQIIVQEEVRVQEVAPLKTEPPQVETKKGKKKTTESGSGDNTDATSSAAGLIQMVRTAVLSETEMTMLVEILQGKQGTPAQWTKKSKQTDAVAVLKKQLEEKDRMFQDEHNLAQNAAQKLRDLRADLSRERQRYEGLERQSSDKMKVQEQEKEALRARMQQTHEQHVVEVTGLRRQVEVAKLSQDQAGLVQRLTEENQKLKEAAAQAQANARRDNNDKQALKMLQEELSKNVVKLSASANTNKQLEVQLTHYKEQLQKHEAASRQINEVTEDLRRSEARNVAVTKDLETARSSAARSEQDLTNVHNRMKDLQAQESHTRSLEQQLQESIHSKKNLESRLNEVERTNKTTESQLRQLREENNLLAAQLKESKERTSGEGQEAPAAEVNGEVSTPAKPDPETTRLLDEKQAQITKLQSELQAKDQEASKLSSDLDAQKQKNNALREKNWKAMDALSQAEKKAESAIALKANLSTKDTELERLKNELQMAVKQKHEIVSKQEAVVVELKQQATHKEDQLSLVKPLQDELSAKKEQLKELDSLREQLAELKDTQSTVESYKVELVQKNEQLNTLDELKKQLEEQSRQLSALNELKKEVTQKESEITELKELRRQFEDREKQLSVDLEAQSKNKESEVVSLTEQLSKLKEENKDLQKSTESSSVQMSSQLEAVKAELGTKNTEVSSLHHKVQELETSLANLKKDADKSADAERLVGELDATTERLQKVSKELEDVRSENQELRAGCSQAAAALTKAERSAEETIAQVQTELNNKVAEVARLSHRLEESRAQNSALQQEAVTKSAAQVQLASSPAPAEKATSLQDVTILTRVEEKSSFDVSHLITDLEARDVELSILQNVLSQKEAENRKLKEQLTETNSLRREVNDRASEVASLTQQLNLQKQKTHNTRSQYLMACESLAYLETCTQQIATLQEELKQRVSEVVRLQKELEAQRRHNAEMHQQLAQGGQAGRAAEPRVEVTQLKEQLEMKEAEIINLRDVVKGYWIEKEALREKLDALEEAEEQQGAPGAAPGVDREEVARLAEEVSGVRGQLDERTVRVDELEKSNSELLQRAKELEDKNSTLSEDLQKSKQASSEQKDLKNELQNTKQALHRVFPDITVSETTKHSEWLSLFEKQAKQYLLDASKSGDVSKELEESVQSQSRLQAQVHQYKEVLADTEGILNKLQNSVEEEEKKWRHRVATSEDRCSQLDQEVKTLRGKLSTIEDDKLALQSKISESTQSLNSLKTEMEEITNQSTNKEEEVSKVKQDLEEAFKQKKELTSATIKLNGMLKTGQDALKAEQELVAKLRAQLAEKSKGLANGSSRPQEIEQLKMNLAQTQRQLEREVQVNKHLTQRLDAGAENSADGTSV